MGWFIFGFLLITGNVGIEFTEPVFSVFCIPYQSHFYIIDDPIYYEKNFELIVKSNEWRKTE